MGSNASYAEDPIKVGHLTYHTGAFGDFGAWFDAITDFTLEVINEDPPLGREMTSLHQDIGTIGEASAARKLIQKDGVEVLLNPAHEYLSYRSWMQQNLKANNSPLMPSVHGGGIKKDIGGTPEEPIFRGAPMDTAQSTAAILKAKELGGERVVLVATEIEGSQLQLEGANHAAKKVGLNIVDELSVASEQPSYRAAVNRIKKANPDTMVIFSQSQDGGTIVKQLAEAGLSLTIIGTQEWMSDVFPKTATDAALDQHKLVWATGYSFVEGPGYDFYRPRLEASKYADMVNELTNSYNIQYYDLLIVTALAIEKAGSTEANKWAQAVREVSMGPGKKVHTYKEGIQALRAGEDIDYTGLTGEFDYGPTGVVSGILGMFEWQGGELVQVSTVDGKAVLENDL